MKAVRENAKGDLARFLSDRQIDVLAGGIASGEFIQHAAFVYLDRFQKGRATVSTIR